MLKKGCVICGKTKCYAHCQANGDSGKHEADPRSAQQADGADFIVDFNCKHCHQSGSIAVDPAEIEWE